LGTGTVPAQSAIWQTRRASWFSGSPYVSTIPGRGQKLIAQQDSEFSRMSKNAGQREMAMAAYIIGMQKIASLASPKKELLSKDFLSSSRMTSNSEVIHLID